LKNEQKFAYSSKYAIGHPRNPLSRKQQLDKFFYCWKMAENKIPHKIAENVIHKIDNLEKLKNTTELIDLITI